MPRHSFIQSSTTKHWT